MAVLDTDSGKRHTSLVPPGTKGSEEEIQRATSKHYLSHLPPPSSGELLPRSGVSNQLCFSFIMVIMVSSRECRRRIGRREWLGLRVRLRIRVSY